MKKYFACESCGNQYLSEEEAIACEEKHLFQKRRIAELLKEQDSRKRALIDARKNYVELLDAYNKDYGNYIQFRV